MLWNTLKGCPLVANDVITMLRTEVDSRTGGKVIVCVDEKDRTHRLPDDCKDIEVVPYKMSSASIRREREKSRKIHRSSKESIQAAPPPALPRRPEALQAAAKKPARAYQQFQPAMTGPSGRAIRHMTDEVCISPGFCLRSTDGSPETTYCRYLQTDTTIAKSSRKAGCRNCPLLAMSGKGGRCDGSSCV